MIAVGDGEVVLGRELEGGVVVGIGRGDQGDSARLTQSAFQASAVVVAQAQRQGIRAVHPAAADVHPVEVQGDGVKPAGRDGVGRVGHERVVAGQLGQDGVADLRGRAQGGLDGQAVV